jgi:hypothetical protein
MLRHRWLKCFLFVKVTLCTTLVFGASEKTAVPLFLFSGQSNMVCLGSSVSDLPSEDQKMSFENIKIHNRSDQASQGWSTLKPGFGGDANHFGPELYFGKVLADSMPDTKMAFIKDASSGTYLGQSGGWLPPSSGGPGTLYKNMMNHIDKALDDFNDAFDTSEYEPRWAGFIWHQGEFDGWNDQSLANKYEENLTNLINDLREMAGDDSMPAIIPMITGSMWQYKDIVRAAEIAVAEKLVNTDTTDTDGFALSSDNIHFNAASQIKIGTNCALRWLAMDFTEGWWDPVVPVVYHSTPAAVPSLMTDFTIFDLSGRKVATAAMSSIAHQSPSMVLIRASTSKSGKQSVSRMLDIHR